MRSVDGWVREADPTSKRRQGPLERHMAALRRKGNPKPRGKRNDPRPLGSSAACAGGDSGSGGGGSTFLTELETDGGAASNRGPSLGQGADGVRNRTRSLEPPRRRSSLGPSPARRGPRTRGRISVSGMARRQEARRRSSGAGTGPASTEASRRRAVGAGGAGGGVPGEAGRRRTMSVGALDRSSIQQHQQPWQDRALGSSGKALRAEEQGQEGLEGSATQPPAPGVSGDWHVGRNETGSGASGIPNRPIGAWNAPSPGGVDSGIAPVRHNRLFVFVAFSCTVSKALGPSRTRQGSHAVGSSVPP